MTFLHTNISVVLLLLSHLIPTALAFVSVVHHSNSISAHQMTSSSDDINFNNDNDMIHWAIIGLGDVCTIKSGPAFYKSHGSTLSAVMRRTPNAARQWIETNAHILPTNVCNSIKGYDNIKDMIHDMSSQGRKLDAIYIASPPGAHLENVRSLCNAIDTLPSSSSSKTNNNKIKAVYVEKPCGRCAWETNAMIDELKHRNIKFYPAYVSRAHERTQVLQKLLQDGIIGDKIVNVKYTQVGSSLARGLDDNGSKSSNDIPWRLNAQYSGGGLIMDMGCHVLDRLDYLFGPILNVKSNVLRKGKGESYSLVEDYVHMTAMIGECSWSTISSEGATVECTWDFSPPNKDESKEEIDELIITGNQGSIRLGGMGSGLPIDILDMNGKLIKTIEFDAPLHPAQPLIQAVVNELRHVKDDEVVKDDLARSPARADNAVRSSEVLDSILGSYYGGRHDDYWRRADTWPGLSRGEEE